MDNWRKKLETLSNIAVIICCILFAVFLIGNFILESNKQRTRGKPPLQTSLVGKKLSLEDLRWTNNQQTLVLVLQTGCRFCDESTPFYQRLTKELASQSKTHLVVLFPQNYNESKQYLKNKMIEIAYVRQVSLQSIGVQGTPTLILVDSSGTVLEQWVGKLPATQEDAVLARLKQQ